MSLLPVFNGRETFQNAFTWNHTQIIAFFNRVQANPTLYGVETRSQTTLATAVTNIVDRITRSEVYLANPVTVSYQGTNFTHSTLFDLIGWVFSVTGTSPTGATPSNYYYPLTALYAQFCSIGSGDLTNAPGVVQLTYFTERSGIVRAALGATLVTPRRSKDAARINRFNQMQHAVIVFEAERNLSYVEGASTDTGQPTYKQLFGHCCESWPFLYIDAKQSQITLGTARGWASNTAGYIMETGFQYREQDIVGSRANACQNCQRLIQRVNLTLANFMPVPTTFELEGQAVSDDVGEDPSHAN